MTVSGHAKHAMGKQKEFHQEHIDFLEVVTVFGALSTVQIIGYMWHKRLSRSRP
jgi:hypothetical protein